MKAYSLLRSAGVDLPLEQRLYDLERRLAEKGVLPAPAVVPGRIPIAPGTAFERERGLTRSVDETYFRMYIEPGVGITDPGITLDVTTFNAPIMDMPPGVTTVYRRTMKARELWPRTVTRLNLWYTSDVGNTATFTVGFNGRQHGEGFILSAMGSVFTHSFAIPGPAVANTEMFATFRTTGTMRSTPELFSFTFFRSNADLNPNDLRIIFGELVFEEVA